MPYLLTVLPEARQDIVDCALWYDDNIDPTGELGDAFIDAVDQTLDRIEENPTHYGYRHDDVRGIHVKRNAPKGRPRKFPHIIFYRFREDEITVVQVFPMKDDDKKIRH